MYKTNQKSESGVAFGFEYLMFIILDKQVITDYKVQHYYVD